MNEPTDTAIDTLILEHGVMGQAWPTQRQLHAFARAVLAKWGIPAPVGVEPVAIYHGRCTIDCGEHGHLDMELLKMIPAGTKLYTAAQAKAAPDFYTVFARYEEEDGETGWIPLPGYSNETEHGVKNLVLEAARKEGYAGTAAGRLMELGWEIRPVYLAAAPAAPVREPLAAETITKIVMDVEQQHHFFRGTTNWAVAVGRAIEFAHGITAPSGKRENK